MSSSSASEEKQPTSSVGFVGLGIMGEGMAARLLSETDAGSSETAPFYVWNRTRSKCEALKSRFPSKKVIVCDTPREAVEKSRTVYSILSTPEVSRKVFEAEDGVLSGVSKDTMLVDCATLAESDMKRMSDAVRAKGGRFLEAPVSGSKGPAAAGTLIFLCAGSKPLFESVASTGLSAMGKASHFFSEDVGAGTRAKLVVNSLMGTMMVAFSEALNLSEASGLDGDTMVEVISQGAIASPMFALKGPKMIRGDHAPNFPLKHAHKDMALASELAKEVGPVEFSVMDQAEKVLRDARQDKKLEIADDDFSAVHRRVQKESDSRK